MHVAIYARVSSMHQAQAQTMDQQLDRLRAHAEQQGWSLTANLVFRDDGYSGASLRRPGLDRLRDAAAAIANRMQVGTSVPIFRGGGFDAWSLFDRLT